MARVAARAMYVALNFSVEAADKLIDNEGLITTDDLKELDQDRVRDIVAAIRKPGGLSLRWRLGGRRALTLAPTCLRGQCTT